MIRPRVTQGSTNGTWRRLSCALEPSQPCVARCLKIGTKYFHCDIYIYNIDIDIEHIYIYMYIYVYIYTYKYIPGTQLTSFLGGLTFHFMGQIFQNMGRLDSRHIYIYIIHISGLCLDEQMRNG